MGNGRHETIEEEIACELQSMGDRMVDSAFRLALEAGATAWFKSLPKNSEGMIELDDDSFDHCGIENAKKLFYLFLELHRFAEELTGQQHPNAAPVTNNDRPN